MGRGFVSHTQKLAYVKGIGAFCKKLSKNFCSEKIKSEVVYLAFLSAVMPKGSGAIIHCSRNGIAELPEPRCRPRISARANARGIFCGTDGRRSARQ